MLPDCDPIKDASDSLISLEDAIAWTGNYQSQHPNELRSVYFPKNVFEALLEPGSAKGIRIYLANSSPTADAVDTMILVGATEDSDLTTEGEYSLYDHGTGSPPCIISSPLSH